MNLFLIIFPKKYQAGDSLSTPWNSYYLGWIYSDIDEHSNIGKQIKKRKYSEFFVHKF